MSFRRAFNDPAAPPAWVCEPLVFETENGIAGIAGRYNFPSGMTPAAFMASRMVAYAFAEADIRHLQKLWLYLGMLNPALHALPVDKADREALKMAVIGVASLYNVDDLKCQAEIWNKEKSGEGFRAYVESKETQRYAAQIYALFPKGDITWLASPKTLESMRNQIARKRYDAEQARKNQPPAP